MRMNLLAGSGHRLQVNAGYGYSGSHSTVSNGIIIKPVAFSMSIKWEGTFDFELELECERTNTKTWLRRSTFKNIRSLLVAQRHNLKISLVCFFETFSFLFFFWGGGFPGWKVCLLFSPFTESLKRFCFQTTFSPSSSGTWLPKEGGRSPPLNI